jgi:hypothetical protein
MIFINNIERDNFMVYERVVEPTEGNWSCVKDQSVGQGINGFKARSIVFSSQLHQVNNSCGTLPKRNQKRGTNGTGCTKSSHTYSAC